MPKKPAQKFLSDAVKFLLLCASIVILLFSLFAIHIYLVRMGRDSLDVLGMETSLEQEKEVWTELLNENPNYFPGWLELARIEEALGDLEASAKAKAKANSISP